MLESFLIAFYKIYNVFPPFKKLHNYFSVRITSKPIVADLLRYGSFRSKEWKIPLNLLISLNEKREWLRAFFDAEGYVGEKEIVVQSINQRGLLQVQYLLKLFNINSRFYQYKRKQKNLNINYLLKIMKKEDRRRYLNKISFNHSRKLKKLSAGVA